MSAELAKMEQFPRKSRRVRSVAYFCPENVVAKEKFPISKVLVFGSVQISSSVSKYFWSKFIVSFYLETNSSEFKINFPKFRSEL